MHQEPKQARYVIAQLDCTTKRPNDGLRQNRVAKRKNYLSESHKERRKKMHKKKWKKQRGERNRKENRKAKRKEQGKGRESGRKRKGRKAKHRRKRIAAIIAFASNWHNFMISG